MKREDLFYILGLCLSDVSIHEHKGEIYLTLKSSKECMRELFLKVLRKVADNIYFSSSEGGKIKKACTKIYARIKKSNKNYNDFKKILEVKENIMKLKEIARSIDDIFSLFVGLFDGDGSITLLKNKHVVIKITSTDIVKLECVRELFKEYDYLLNVTKDGKTGISNRQKYALRIPKKYQELFIKLIAHRSLHKERREKAKIILKMLKGYINFDYAYEFVTNYKFFEKRLKN